MSLQSFPGFHFIIIFTAKLISMSLFNNNNKKKKGNKQGNQQPAKPGFAPKAKANTKAATRNTKLTGGSQRGS
jgi:hypothetical protein